MILRQIAHLNKIVLKGPTITTDYIVWLEMLQLRHWFSCLLKKYKIDHVIEPCRTLANHPLLENLCLSNNSFLDSPPNQEIEWDRL